METAAEQLRYVSELTKKQSEILTRSRQNWTAFLDTAANLYKYPFHEQLMIFAQRPDATACASVDDWNNVKNRRDYKGNVWHCFVKRGSKGIALVDTNGDKPKLRYVFDAADTEVKTSQKPNI